jgi:hypothetical protein
MALEKSCHATPTAQYALQILNVPLLLVVEGHSEEVPGPAEVGSPGDRVLVGDRFGLVVGDGQLGLKSLRDLVGEGVLDHTVLDAGTQ